MWQGSAASSGKWASIWPGQFSVPVSVGHRLGQGPTGMVDRLAGRSMSRMTALSRWRMASRSRADSVRRRSVGILPASQRSGPPPRLRGIAGRHRSQHVPTTVTVHAPRSAGLASDQFRGLVVERDTPLQTSGLEEFVFTGFAPEFQLGVRLGGWPDRRRRRRHSCSQRRQMMIWF